MRIIVITIISLCFLSTVVCGQTDPTSALKKAVATKNYDAAIVAVGEDKGSPCTPINTATIIYEYLSLVEIGATETYDKGIDWLFSLLPKDASDVLNSFRGDVQENTILHMASMKFYSHAIQKAFEHGASPFVRESSGQTPYDMVYNGLAASMNPNLFASSPAMVKELAAHQKNVERAQNILLEEMTRIEQEALKDPNSALFFYTERLDLEGIKKALADGADINAMLGSINKNPLYKHLLLSNHQEEDNPITIAVRNTFIQKQPYQQTAKEQRENGLNIIELFLENGAFNEAATYYVIKQIEDDYDRANIKRIIGTAADIRLAKKMLLSNDDTSIWDAVDDLLELLNTARENNDQKLARTITETLSGHTELMEPEQLEAYNELSSFTKTAYANRAHFEFNETKFRDIAIEFLTKADPFYAKTISTLSIPYIARISIESITRVITKTGYKSLLSKLISSDDGIMEYLYQRSKDLPEDSNVRASYINSLAIFNSLSSAFLKNEAIKLGFTTQERFQERTDRINTYTKDEIAKNPELKRLLEEKYRDLKEAFENIKPFMMAKGY